MNLIQTRAVFFRTGVPFIALSFGACFFLAVTGAIVLSLIPLYLPKKDVSGGGTGIIGKYTLLQFYY